MALVAINPFTEAVKSSVTSCRGSTAAEQRQTSQTSDTIHYPSMAR